MLSVLVTEKWLIALKVITRAVADHVVYMELVFRPNTHTQRGLTPVEALDIYFEHSLRDYLWWSGNIVLDAKQKLEDTLPIKVGVIVYGSAGPDDPIQVWFAVA